MELCYRAYYKVAGMDDEEIAWPELYFDDKEVADAEVIINTHKKTFGEKPIALFHTGKTNWLGRNLELHKFESVAKHLQDNGWSIIEVGGRETDKMGIESTKLQGVDTIHPRISMAVISKTNLFVGIDSFPWNVAQTCKIPSVVGFGCINPKMRILDDKLVTAVQSTSKYCLGCHHEYRGPINESQCMRKRSGYNKTISAPCMEDISVEQLIKAVDKHINGQEQFIK
jgi:ADP-heptose:LPS heptosyltransferase